MTYKAEYENEEMVVFEEQNHSAAYDFALTYEKEYGTLWNLILLDEDYNEIESVLA